MTENCAAALVQPLTDEAVGAVGCPTPCTEVKLRDTDDYRATDAYPLSEEAFQAQVRRPYPLNPKP